MVWAKGQSGNPKGINSGRPRGFKGLAKQVRDTVSMEGMVKFAIDTWECETNPMSMRWSAMEWLADRGWGKAQQIVDLKVTGESSMDLGHLTDAELASMAETLELAKMRSEGKVIEMIETEPEVIALPPLQFQFTQNETSGKCTHTLLAAQKGGCPICQ